MLTAGLIDGIVYKGGVIKYVFYTILSMLGQTSPIPTSNSTDYLKMESQSKGLAM